jgi:hypothetical protein
LRRQTSSSRLANSPRKPEIKHVSGKRLVDFFAPKRDHYAMPQVIERDAFLWLMGALAGAALAGSADAATLDALGRWSFHWLAEPFTRLAYFGAFCG